MGFKMRKTIKVAPGVKINLGKKSAGISIGGKYGGMSFNTKRGATARVSAPGTGISYTTKVGGSRKTKATNSKTATPSVECSRPKNKWISLLLCLFTICGHKFYEGKIGIGFLYLITVGIFGIGWIVDILTLLFKPNPYYV